MIAIIDYGMGNLASLVQAFHKLGAPNKVFQAPPTVEESKIKAILLPGVGAMRPAMDCLNNKV